MSLLSNSHVGLTDRSIEVSGYHTSYKRRRSSNENTEEQTHLIDGRSGIYDPDQQTKTVCIYVYISHFLSAWGDRMWQFGVGLFLVIIAPDSLLLTAVYGFVNGAAILLFGPMVGDWVDRTARLSAARISLIVQNLSIAVCAVVIYFVIYFKTEIEEEWPDKWLLNICFGIIILIAVIAQLASTGNTIAVEKDWIVEICGDDTDLLARTSAILKSIDLVTNIVAPIATGQIMAYGSTEIGALFIGGWNVVSVFVEYYLLWKVYNEVPALRARKDFRRIEDSNEDGRSKRSKCTGCLYGLFESFIILFRGGRTYMTYDVAFAGLSLAAVYMTVLGFDNITVGFAYTQGINESVMGGLMAAGALVGILGTFIYPWMRKRIGIKKTGTFGLSFQILFLCLCVGSVWAPGSPFDLNFADRNGVGIKLANKSDDSSNFYTAHPLSNTTDVGDMIYENGGIKFVNNISDGALISSYLYTTHPLLNTTDIEVIGENGGSFVVNYLSISLLMAGIIGARCGLWITDLTITQLFLETVEEKERGIVLGVQTALNQLMDMIKFIMVIMAPQPELFGLLVLISFAFVCMGWGLYAKYVFGTNHRFKNSNSFLAI